MALSDFDIEACTAALSAATEPFGAAVCAFQLIALKECDSTNTQLMQLADNGAASGTVVVTDHQTAGRGRRNRSWISSPQDSLTFSLLWRFPSNSSAPEALSLAVGLALQRALARAGAAVAVKWPNDILYKGRKLAGVLIETQSGDIKSTVIGVGINLRLPPHMPDEIARNAIALDEVMPAQTRESLLVVLLTHLATTLTHYSAEGFSSLRSEWQARHAFENCEVQISGANENFSLIYRERS